MKKCLNAVTSLWLRAHLEIWRWLSGVPIVLTSSVAGKTATTESGFERSSIALDRNTSFTLNGSPRSPNLHFKERDSEINER